MSIRERHYALTPMNRGERSWPKLDRIYTDECGGIDPEVYEAAGEIWPQAERLALSVLQDSGTGLQLMMRAAAIVSRRRTLPDLRIENLQAFLFQVYKRLVLAELRKQNHRRELEAQYENDLARIHDTSHEIDQKILLEQLCQRMDKWTRDVFEFRMLGYTFEDIGTFLGMRANHVRSGFSKRLAKLREELRK